MKIILIVIDGLGDETIPELGNQMPLEAAKTPNLDWLAARGVCGLTKPVFYGAIPTSEEGHFALFGYDPKAYQLKRGILTALGAGMEVEKGDIALRGNFATVNDAEEIIDRRAGRISDTEPLISSLNGSEIKGIKFFLKNAGEYRLAIMMRGRGLSANISDGDPHYGKLGIRVAKIEPLDKSEAAIFTAKILNEFLEKSHLILSKHPLNKKREELGLLPANYILTRGVSAALKIPSFKERYGLTAACIAGKLLYRQIGEILGMDLINVKGANGLINTNLKGKIKAAKDALKKYDFVFLHIKATDSLAEDGKFNEKKKFIEKIDKNLTPLINVKNTLMVITSDHSTCSLLKRHCDRPCPVLISLPRLAKKKRKPSVVKTKKGKEKFSEKSCQKGELGVFRQTELMPKILRLAQP